MRWSMGETVQVTLLTMIHESCMVTPGPERARFLLLLLLLALSPAGLGQSTVTVRIMTDSPLPADFGTSYSLGQLGNTTFTYGPNFIIEVSYDLASATSVSLALEGVQADYELAWRVDGTTDNRSLGAALGTDVPDLTGSASGLYYRNDGTLRTLSTEATRYRIGARSTPAAVADLQVQVTLTVTLY
jgi:hypothetical protein